MCLVLVQDGYRSTDSIFLVLTKVQGHRPANFTLSFAVALDRDMFFLCSLAL